MFKIIDFGYYKLSDNLFIFMYRYIETLTNNFHSNFMIDIYSIYI